jgi:hypothetical protein
MAFGGDDNVLTAVVPPGATAYEAFSLMLLERVAALELAHAQDVAARNEAVARHLPTPGLAHLTSSNLDKWQASRRQWKDDQLVCLEANQIASRLLENDDPDGIVHRIRHQANLQRLRGNGFVVTECDGDAGKYRVKKG